MRFRHTMMIFWILFGSLGISGCSTAMQASSPMPSPVSENGMTLNWGADVKRQAIKMIDASRQTCYFDIYELSDPDVLAALNLAHRRGVDVRVIVDATEKHSQQQGLPTLRHDGVPVASLKISHGISHIKMLWVDGTVLMGGMNFGQNSWHNNDASVFLTQANPSFLGLFRWDWARSHLQPAAIIPNQSPLVSDRTTRQHVLQAIQNAHQNVYMEAFDLTDFGVLDALKAAHKRGIQIEVLLDPGQSPNRSSAVKLKAAGIMVRFYRPYQGEWMHAKILDVDGGQTFIIGSANFTHQAYVYNHEGDLELHNVPQFSRSFEQNLALQVSRGTDYPLHTQQYGT